MTISLGNRGGDFKLKLKLKSGEVKLDDDKRSFYEHECINAHWSFRKLKRQIDSSLFERLLLSDGQANKERVIARSEISRFMER